MVLLCSRAPTAKSFHKLLVLRIVGANEDGTKDTSLANKGEDEGCRKSTRSHFPSLACLAGYGAPRHVAAAWCLEYEQKLHMYASFSLSGPLCVEMLFRAWCMHVMLAGRGSRTTCSLRMMVIPLTRLRGMVFASGRLWCCVKMYLYARMCLGMSGNVYGWGNASVCTCLYMSAYICTYLQCIYHACALSKPMPPNNTTLNP